MRSDCVKDWVAVVFSQKKMVFSPEECGDLGVPRMYDPTGYNGELDDRMGTKSHFVMIIWDYESRGWW